jgi:hypothetical protein
MTDKVRALAAASGVRVELAPLGDWGSARLIAEYDPDGPTIRVNTTAVPHDDDDAIERAVAHELYHHYEAIGRVARIAGRAEREAAADAFAERMTGAPA